MAEKPKDPLKDWVTPAVALARAKLVFSSPISAMDALGVRIRDGLLNVSAREAITVASGKPDQTGKNVAIQKVLWAHLRGGWTGQPHLWTAGQVDIWTERGEVRVSLHDVLFDPVGLDAYLRPLETQSVNLAAGRAVPVPVVGAAPKASSPPPKPQILGKPDLKSIDPKDRRGPSPKEFWDDMLLAMFRRIYVDGWEPERLADLEKAMHTWLAERGKSAGERTVRNIAKKLLEAVKD